MKKVVSLFLVLMLGVLLCGCGGPDFSTDEEKMVYALAEIVIDGSDEEYDKDYFGKQDFDKDYFAICDEVEVYTLDEVDRSVNGFADDADKLVKIKLVYCGDKFWNDCYKERPVMGVFNGVELRELTYMNTEDMSLEQTFSVPDTVPEVLGIMGEREFFEDRAFDVACKYVLALMKSLKYPYTLELDDVYCYVNLERQASPFEGAEYYFSVLYSADNDLGNKKTSMVGNGKRSPVGYSYGARFSTIDDFQNTYYKFAEDEKYAKNQENCIKLDAKAIQKYVLDNF